MDISYVVLLAFALLCLVIENANANPTTTTSSTVSPQPVYKPQEPKNGYIPHTFYPYATTYAQISPNRDYAYNSAHSTEISSDTSSLLPTAPGIIQTALRILAKVGLFLMGGVALLLVGGIFTTAVCSITPLCTITFSGFGEIDKDTMRSFMTPEKISAAAALVQDAFGKYQHLQRAINN